MFKVGDKVCVTETVAYVFYTQEDGSMTEYLNIGEALLITSTNSSLFGFSLSTKKLNSDREYPLNVSQIVRHDIFHSPLYQLMQEKE